MFTLGEADIPEDQGRKPEVLDAVTVFLLNLNKNKFKKNTIWKSHLGNFLMQLYHKIKNIV